MSGPMFEGLASNLGASLGGTRRAIEDRDQTALVRPTSRVDGTVATSVVHILTEVSACSHHSSGDGTTHPSCSRKTSALRTLGFTLLFARLDHDLLYRVTCGKTPW